MSELKELIKKFMDLDDSLNEQLEQHGLKHKSSKKTLINGSLSWYIKYSVLFLNLKYIE